MSFRLADVGLLSAAKNSSSLTNWSGVTRDLFRRCFAARPSAPPRAEHDIARRMMGFCALDAPLAEGTGGATSDSVGDSAEERLGDDATDSDVSCTAARELCGLSGMNRGARVARGLVSDGSCLTT